MIVGAIVLVWVLVASIANRSVDTETLVRDIERLNSDSWRKALTLAQQLRDPDQAELRQNEEMAGRLATLLDKQVEGGAEDGRSLRIYLCSALGKFEVPTGSAALVKAATTEQQIEDVDVRRAALQGIGTLVEQLPASEVVEQPKLLAAVIEGTDAYAEEGDERRRRELLRSTATYVLGVFPGEEATERLAKLIHDPCLDVGYNAAIGLARRGDERALPMLSEMLDPPPEALVDEDVVDDPTNANAARNREGREQWKRSHIMENALRAIAKMRTDHPAVQIDSLKTDVQSVVDNESVPLAIQLMAKEVLQAWK